MLLICELLVNVVLASVKSLPHYKNSEGNTNNKFFSIINRFTLRVHLSLDAEKMRQNAFAHYTGCFLNYFFRDKNFRYRVFEEGYWQDLLKSVNKVIKEAMLTKYYKKMFTKNLKKHPRTEKALIKFLLSFKNLKHYYLSWHNLFKGLFVIVSAYAAH